MATKKKAVTGKGEGYKQPLRRVVSYVPAENAAAPEPEPPVPTIRSIASRALLLHEQILDMGQARSSANGKVLDMVALRTAVRLLQELKEECCGSAVMAVFGDSLVGR